MCAGGGVQVSLNDDLADWAGSRPDWQQDAIARFCRNEALTDGEVLSTVDQLIAGTYPAATPISADDIPGSVAAGEPVTLSDVGDVRGVNALLADQTLSFAEAGLTVIYGDNASGKSGYARLIREAVTARVGGDLLGNVFSDDVVEQEFTVGYATGGNADIWRFPGAKSNQLSRVRFFDTKCGYAYVTKASEASYRPSAFVVLDLLTQACRALREEIDQRLAANDAGRPQLPMLHQGSPAYLFRASIDASTTDLEIEAACALDEEHSNQLAKALAEEARLKVSDPGKERSRLLGMAANWSIVAERAKLVGKALDDAGLQDLEIQRKAATDLRQAARIASSSDFDAEPIEGVGSNTWRALWSAARAFSESEAYHEHDFPHTQDGAVCVLCQQPLTADGADRLARFEAFTADTTARDADEAEVRLAESRKALVELQSQPDAVATALTELAAAGADVASVRDWLTTSGDTAKRVVAWTHDDNAPEPAALVDTVSRTADTVSNELETAAGAIDPKTFQEQLAVASQRVLELQDAAALSDAAERLKTEVARLSDRARLEEVKSQTETTGITTRKTHLTDTYVTVEVSKRFTRECEGFDLRKVTLARARGRYDATIEHLPTLAGASGSEAIDSVLSEGEQTALGLAGFLTEIEMDQSKSGVVFADPVSSLDAGRRRRVAKRLVELAQERQVIVFTHEITFVHALSREADDRGTLITPRAIQRRGEDQPGLVLNEYPWEVKEVPSRIDRLTVELGRLERDRGQLTTEEYGLRVGGWAGSLSKTWERVVSADIINRVMDRATGDVHVTMLKIIERFNHADNHEYQSGYNRLSGWAERHDNAPEQNYVAPTIDELRDELEKFKVWYARVKTYKQ